jgi:hypothetical protein
MVASQHLTHRRRRCSRLVYDERMTDPRAASVPLVAGHAFRERLALLPAAFDVALQPEPDNRYNPKAIAAHAGGGKIGFVAPEIARHYYDGLLERTSRGEAVTCPARRVGGDARIDVCALLDCSALADLRNDG